MKRGAKDWSVETVGRRALGKERNLFADVLGERGQKMGAAEVYDAMKRDMKDMAPVSNSVMGTYVTASTLTFLPDAWYALPS